MKCSGIDAITGYPVSVTFDKTITAVETPDAGDGARRLAPGWIDVQVNGYGGVDYNHPGTAHEDIARSIRMLFAAGVTRFFPTVITGPPDDMAGALRNLAEACERLEEGPAMEAFHVEGPHISQEDGPRGAHPRRWVRRPDAHEFHRMQEAARGRIRLVTLSPEWPEAPRYIETIVAEGVVASIGHTNATPQQIADAVSAGATMSTHLGNGAHPVLARHPNYIWEQLADDRLAASFIADGVHLGAAFLKAALRAKGEDRRVLVTDAAMPAGCAPGRYKIGEVEVELLPEGRIVVAGQNRLAASALRIDRAISNVVRLAGLSLGEAVRMATVTPARVTRVAGRERGLVAGDRADIVEFRYDSATHEVRVEKTWMRGKLVYLAESS